MSGYRTRIMVLMVVPLGLVFLREAALEELVLMIQTERT